MSLWKDITAIHPDGERKVYKLKSNGSLLKALPRAAYRHRPRSAPQTTRSYLCDIPDEPDSFDELSCLDLLSRLDFPDGDEYCDWD